MPGVKATARVEGREAPVTLGLEGPTSPIVHVTKTPNGRKLFFVYGTTSLDTCVIVDSRTFGWRVPFDSRAALDGPMVQVAKGTGSCPSAVAAGSWGGRSLSLGDCVAGPGPRDAAIAAGVC
jgi:hypothetical protein